MQDISQKTIRIALDSPDQALLAQQGSYPTKQIEPLVVLAGSGDTKTLALFSPTTPQARMKAKTGFVLKDNDLIWLQSL